MTIGKGLRPSAWPTARAPGVTESRRDVAIGPRLAGRNGPCHFVDPSIELRHARKVDGDRPQVDARSGEERADVPHEAIDRRWKWRRHFYQAQAQSGESVSRRASTCLRQLQPHDARHTPGETAHADGRLEERDPC